MIGQSQGNWTDTPVTARNIDNLEGVLIGVQNSLSVMKINLESDIEKMQGCILQTTKKIDELQVRNNKLRKKLRAVKNSAAAGEGKVYDSQLIYNQNYLGNCILGAIICYLLYRSVHHYMINQKNINNTVVKSANKLSDMVVNSASLVRDNIDKIDNNDK